MVRGMSVPTELLAPYLVTNLFALVLLVLALRAPAIARWVFVVLFAGAAAFNVATALRTPGDYVMFADHAVAPLAAWLRGWFATHVALVVLPIAAGQGAIAALLASRGGSLRLGVLGAVLFFAGIAFLGVGSAFPFSITASVAIVVMGARVEVPSVGRLLAVG